MKYLPDGIGLYIHVPFCRQKFLYCDFYSSIISEKVYKDYIGALLRAVKYWGGRIDRPVDTVYFGGGTPSVLGEDIARIMRAIRSEFDVLPDSEITAECNPDSDRPFLRAAKKCGVNRLSVGLQAMKDEALAVVNRRAHRAENLRALRMISEYWLEQLDQAESACLNYRLSVDLICGLPSQSAEDFFSGLDEAISSGADHISLYSLSLEEGTPLYNAVDSGKVELPETEETDLWWIKARDILEANGFEQYEVSNFAKKGCKSRHNMTYWKMNPYVGIGAGATGTVKDLRYTNSRSIEDWLNGEGEERETLPLNIQQFEYLMMSFRTLDGADITEFERRFGKSIDIIEPVFSSWCQKGLAEKTDSRYALNKQGLLLLNRFLEEIICYFE